VQNGSAFLLQNIWLNSTYLQIQLQHFINWRHKLWLKCVYCTRDSMKVISPLFFFYRNYNHNYNEIYIHHRYINLKVEIIFPHSIPHYQHTFTTFAWDTVCWSHKTLCWSIRALPTCCVSAQCCLQKSMLGVHPSGDKTDVSLRVLNQDCREDEWKQVTPLLQLPPLCADWCAVWHCHAGEGFDSSSCLVKPFKFVVWTTLKSVNTALNWLWHLSPIIPLTRFFQSFRRS